MDPATLHTSPDQPSRLGSGDVWPRPAAVLELLKPITWFAPMWAFVCGVVSSGASFTSTWPLALMGAFLAGPLVCATSQAVNDWYDREVDAINEPGRPIPSGRVPGRWGLWIAIAGSCLSLGFAAALGVWVLAAAAVGLVLAWAYSAPPARLKRSGWWGPGAVALSYEGIAWFTGAAVVLQALPDGRIIALAALYSLGAHGIMSMNDFKAVAGDTALGIRTLPVMFGIRKAAMLACAIMAVPQVAVVGLLAVWGLHWASALVAASVALQLLAMARFVADPAARAPWFNQTGVLLYVLGMMASAIAVGRLLAGATT